MLVYSGMAKQQKAQKVPVSERALIQRINRKLKGDDQKLCAARGTWDGPTWHPNSDLGRYYIIDISRNFLVSSNVDLEDYGRELKVLAPWEELAE